MVTVNAGLLAIWFSPGADRSRVLRDGGFLSAALVWIGTSLADEQWSIWNALGILLVYLVYVVVVWKTEQRRLGSYGAMVKQVCPDHAGGGEGEALMPGVESGGVPPSWYVPAPTPSPSSFRPVARAGTIWS